MKRSLVPVLVAASLAIAACGGGDDGGGASNGSGGPTTAPATGGTSAPGGTGEWGGPGGTLDPRTTSGCMLLTAEQMASITGDVVSVFDNYASNPTSGAGCNWAGSNGRTMQIVIPFADDPATMSAYLGEPSLQAGVGEMGIVYQAYPDQTGFPVIEASINGWYVRFDALGTNGASYTDEEVIAFARLFEAALVPRPADAAPPTSMVDSGGVPGTVSALVATIEAPAYLVGSGTVVDPTVVCTHGEWLSVGFFLLDTPVPGLPVETLIVEVPTLSGSGTYDGTASVYAPSVTPPSGASFSYIERLSEPAQVTWDEATLTARFTLDDGWGNEIAATLTCQS
ncbi:MAG TPA: hypothetical protein DCR14_16025 [Acidimicrobiaceae bacterium]|nr:hypothetical protein [Acidimicrobiaceae bacterium]